MIENEQARSIAAKEMAKAGRENEQREYDAAIRQKKKEKADFLKAKKEMEARLEQDKIERFGLEKYKQMKAEEEAKKKSPL